MMICKGHKVKVQIWDAGGKEEFRSLIRPAYYQKANAVLIVYDITNQASFESVEYWKKQVDENHVSIPTLVLGNKIDLVDDNMISLRIPYETEAQLSDALGVPFRSVSAKTGEGVEDAF